jgi:hypothetical protein
LGGGDTNDSAAPMPVFGPTNAVAVAAGQYSSASILNDGTLISWGWNLYGQLDNGSTNSSSVPLTITNFSGVTAAAISNQTIALTSDGSIWSWGNNDSGQLGYYSGPLGQNNPGYLPRSLECNARPGSGCWFFTAGSRSEVFSPWRIIFAARSGDRPMRYFRRGDSLYARSV